jgi:hypothetical protein
VTVRVATGTGPIQFEVKNATDVPINALYIAKSERIDQAGPGLDFDSPKGQDVWGGDLLSRAAIAPGTRTKIEVPEPGAWDVRAVDRDDRFQHISALKLHPGGRYILELYDSGWRARK